MEEVENKNRISTKKSLPGLIAEPLAHCGALLASTGQLVAPSGLLELLFSTLGGYWGPLRPKLQKHMKFVQNMEPKGKPV